MKKLLFASMVFLGSCKSTDMINRFAKSAANATAEIGSATFHFEDLYKLYNPETLKYYSSDTLALRPSPLKPQKDVMGPAGPISEKEFLLPRSNEYKKADSLVEIINQTLVNYFSLLESVSDKKLLAYNARDLIQALSGIQQNEISGFSLSEEKINAVKGILNTILNEPIKWYRYKTLIRTMQKADSVISRIIFTYSFILDTALTGEIEQAKQNYYSFVYAPIYNHAQNSVEKFYVNQLYDQVDLSLLNEKIKMHKSVLALQTIRKGHSQLAFGKQDSDFKETEAMIARDIILVNGLISEIIQLIK